MTRRLLVLLALPAAIAMAAPAWATFPGRNGKLVFQRPVGKQMDLFTIRPDGTQLKRVLGARVIEEDASWSPDGRRIAFARSAKGGYPTEVWTATPNGRDLRRLTAWGDISTAPAWAPGNRIVYFTTKDFKGAEGLPPSELYSMAADGSDQRRLTHDDVVQTDPGVSPVDGTVAFTGWQPVPGEPDVFDHGLFSITAGGLGLRTLAPFSPDRDAINPNWSPDGSRIVFEIAAAEPPATPGTSDRQSDLAVMNADGTGVRRLTRTRTVETNPVWSPDGRLIAFTSNRHVKRGQRERLGPDLELYVMRADGTRIRRLTHNSIPDLYPDWQPRSKPSVRQ
jgi:Tol biopolymer transport system component